MKIALILLFFSFQAIAVDLKWINTNTTFFKEQTQTAASGDPLPQIFFCDTVTSCSRTKSVAFNRYLHTDHLHTAYDGKKDDHDGGLCTKRLKEVTKLAGAVAKQNNKFDIYVLAEIDLDKKPPGKNTPTGNGNVITMPPNSEIADKICKYTLVVKNHVKEKVPLNLDGEKVKFESKVFTGDISKTEMNEAVEKLINELKPSPPKAKQENKSEPVTGR